MKIRTPRTKVASMAPVLLLMFFSAQRPKAALAPLALTKATMMPSSTRNRKIPALPEIESISPLLRTVSSVVMGAKSQTNSPPTITPRNKDRYACLVIRARMIATKGGISAQNVPYILGAAASSPAAKAVTVMAPHTSSTIARRGGSRLLRFFMFSLSYKKMKS